ncbi:MAG: iron chaperone, partial [Candidatus Hermodarchaeota archaeon]
MSRTKIETIDEYISKFPENVQEILQNLRKTISKSAPEAREAISYQIPTFKLNGNLVHFAAYKNHIGFYPTPSGIEAFKNELTSYKVSKGTIQFPLNKPIPFDLIQKI